MADDTLNRLFYCAVSLVMVAGLAACAWGFIGLIEHFKQRRAAARAKAGESGHGSRRPDQR